MKNSAVVSAMTALLACVAIQAAPVLKENTVFPDKNVIISQLVDETTAGIRDVANPVHAVMGQSFTLTNSATLRAITMKSHNTVTWNSGDDKLELWIGADTDSNPTNFVAGATNLLTTIDVGGVTVTEGNYYTINLDSDLVLPAGEYGFQLRWTSTQASHQWFLRRANSAGNYAGGGLLYGQKTDGSFVDFPLSTSAGFSNDLVFGLHATTIGTIPSFTASPSAISMILAQPNNQVTGTVAVAYTSDTTVDIAMTIVDQSHSGSFSVLSVNPQTLTMPAPSNTVLAVQFDNTVALLGYGATATGLVNIAWSETGSGTTNVVVVPVSATTGYAADANNVFTPVSGAADTWANAANWDLFRVPGVLGADRALVQNPGTTCNVESDFTATFPFKAWVRAESGVSPILNIGADFKGSSEIHVGQAAGQYGMLNHTAGTVETAVVKVGVNSATAVASNSVYNLVGGTLRLNKMTASRTFMTVSTNGTMVVNGGAVSMDLAGVNATATISGGTTGGGGAIKLKSGSIAMTNGVATSVVYMGTPFEVSGGNLNLSGQVRFYSDFKAIGNAATIHFDRIGTYGTACRFIFELGANGVSTIDSVGGYQSLTNAVLVVDGANYTGGSATINLFKSSNLNTKIAASNIVVTNFPAGTMAVVSQVGAPDHAVVLTINVQGYPGWAPLYGLSGTNALATANPDGDQLNNLYEYALGGDPTNSTSIGTQPELRNGAGYVDYVHVRRVAASNELSYALALTPDLLYPTWTTNSGYTVVGHGPVVGDFDTVTNRIDTTGKPAEFIKLIVEQL